jgi:predicted amidohydrolase
MTTPVLPPHKTPDLSEGGHAVLRLALCQVATEPWDIAGNLGRTIAALDDAGRQGAQMALTPECVFHGYAPMEGGPEASLLRLLDAAETIDGPGIAAVREVAARHGIHVLVGFAERDGNRVHNAAAFIGPDGALVDVYRKVHLRPFESIAGTGAFTPGDRFWVHEAAFDGGTVRAGAMICFDREIPESARSLRALGAELVLCPLACDTAAFGAPVNYAHNEELTRARAAENEVFIAVVNHARRMNGGSFVVGPGGEVLVQLGPDAETRVVEVPVGVVRDRFHADPLGWLGWGYRRPEVYARYLG